MAGIRGLLRRRGDSECVGVKFQRSWEVVGKVIHVVAARIQMKLVRYAARYQQIVKFLCALVKAKIIIGAAVEINWQVRGLGAGLYDREGAFPFPIFGINGISERTAKHPGYFLG